MRTEDIVNGGVIFVACFGVLRTSGSTLSHVSTSQTLKKGDGRISRECLVCIKGIFTSIPLENCLHPTWYHSLNLVYKSYQTLPYTKNT